MSITSSILVERERFGISPKKMKITGTGILPDGGFLLMVGGRDSLIC